MQVCSERVQPNAAVLDLAGKCQDNRITTPTSTLSLVPLGQVTIDDAAAASSLFEALMGDEVQPRKEFIDENAKLVVNLDV